MPRRNRPARRRVAPDPIFQSEAVAKFVNIVMHGGKRSIAEKIVYDALDRAGRQAKREPIEVFESALRNATPMLEVKPRRVGGATYQVPIEIRPERRQSLSIRWLVGYARERAEKTMIQRLSGELLDAYNNRGNTFKKKEDTHKMAEANKAFAHYRW